MPKITSLVAEPVEANLISSNNLIPSNKLGVLAPKKVEVDETKLAKLCEAAPKFDSIVDALDYREAGLDEIAHTVGYLMKYADADTIKLQAAKLAAELRGVAKGKDSTTINFIVKNDDSSNVNLMGIFNPLR